MCGRSIVRGLALIVTIPVILLASDELNQRLKRIFDSRAFTGKRFGPARWINGGAAYTTLEDSTSVADAKDIVQHNTGTGERTVLIAAGSLKPPKAEKPLNIEDYYWSHDQKRLLVYTESKKVWRTNTRGDYWVLDRGTGELRKLGGEAPASSLMFAKFSPDGSQVAYVRGNNLYVEDLTTGVPRALTTDGSDTLINGTSDWVYEEELGLQDGFRWSPDGQQIAFWQFDTTGVEQFTLINSSDTLYPVLTRIPYPKVGTKNSAVRIGVIGIKGELSRWIEVPGDARDNYIFRMDWVSSAELAIGQLNRKQNVATIYLADAKTGTAKAIFHDRDEAWVDIPRTRRNPEGYEGFEWLNGRRNFLWLSERDGWKRVYSVPRNGEQPAVITNGTSDVISIQAVDAAGGWVYFIGAGNNATQRYLYRSPLNGRAAPDRVTPLEQAGSHSYDISPDCRWAFHTFSRFDAPPATDLISLPEHRSVRVLQDNSVVRANVAAMVDPPVEFLRVPIASGVTLDGWLLKPRTFDPEKKYPLLIYVYGEPAGTTVVDQWQGTNALFHRAMADAGYVVASFDNRGTPAPKGRDWRKMIYGAVGVLSSQDQVQAVLAAAKERSYIDLSRVAVWGWSGGGSNTLNLMFRAPDLFKVGVAVAPVPDQKLYDTIYQERYMGLPDENAEGYRIGSPIHFADGLRGKLLIVHGSGDDNVHYQGTEKLVNRLIELGKSFDMMVYPNRSHSISEGEGTRLHVFSLIARYIRDNLPAGPK